jgi:hypothetical protein
MLEQRPTLEELGGCQRLGRGLTATVLEWQGLAVKMLCSQRAQENALEGTRRLEGAGVPVLPVLDQWQEEDRYFYVQPVAQEIEWSVEDLDEGIELAFAALEAGVADVWHFNLMEYEGRIVVADPGYTIDKWEVESWSETLREEWLSEYQSSQKGG